MQKSEYAFNSVAMADAASVTLRMLQWWDERKLLQPARDGHRRLYSPQLALLVMVVAALRRKGISLQQLRAAVPEVKKLLAKTAHQRLLELRIAIDTHGSVVAWSTHAHTLLDAIQRADNAVWVIDIGELVARLPQIPTLEKGAAA